MKADNPEIKLVHWAADADSLKAIRQAVFIEEQDVPVELEWDGLDPDCTHFLVYSGSRAIATARLKPDGQIGRMAVLRPYRHNGIGSRLLGAILDHAKVSGFKEVYLHAQVKVMDFYQKFGFIPEGDEFMDAGIPHRAMRKKIC